MRWIESDGNIIWSITLISVSDQNNVNWLKNVHEVWKHLDKSSDNVIYYKGSDNKKLRIEYLLRQFVKATKLFWVLVYSMKCEKYIVNLIWIWYTDKPKRSEFKVGFSFTVMGGVLVSQFMRVRISWLSWY